MQSILIETEAADLARLSRAARLLGIKTEEYIAAVITEHIKKAKEEQAKVTYPTAP